MITTTQSNSNPTSNIYPKYQYMLFYGSLRKNGPVDKTYNFNRFGGQNYIKTLKLPGFKMIDLGYYPCIMDADDSKNNEITVELHQVEENSAKNIENMEIGAGYSKKTINIDGTEAGIYYFPKKNINLDKLKVIESGDWCNEPGQY